MLPLALAAVLLTSPTLAAGATKHVETAKHSGTIVAIDTAGHALTLEEMGPWTGPGKGLVRRTVKITPDTKITRVARTAGTAPDGWPGGFTSSSVTVADVRAGDFVTLTTTSRRGHLVASAIAIDQPGAAGAEAPHAAPGTPRPTTGTSGHVV